MKGMITPWETRAVRQHLQTAVGIRHGSATDGAVGELLLEALGGEYEVKPGEGFLILETRRRASAMTTHGDVDGIAPKIELMSSSIIASSDIPVNRSLEGDIVVTTARFNLCMAYC